MGKLQDLTGNVYGRLTVINRHPLNDKLNKPLWVCQCECGKQSIVLGASLRTGLTRSCGCYNRDIARETGKKLFTKHGKVYSHEWRVWVSMKSRVKRPNKKTYENMSICERWQNSFENFLNDMGESPSDNHQLDRIDNSKGYSPDNCRWVTRSENCRNKTNNVVITWQNQSRCLYEWAEILCPQLGITPDALQSRIKSGWDVNKAFTTPKLKNQFSSSI